MMNALAIGLVLTSLLAAAVWSPSSSAHHADDHREVIVKEGHRVVVVEYDKEADGSTKVLISPPDTETDTTIDQKPPSEGVFSGPRELVCDAYGKCKHKIASAFGKTKDKVEETAHGVADNAKEAVNEAVGKVSESEKAVGPTIGESLGKAKDTVAHGIDKAKEVAGDMAGTVKDGAVKAKNKLDVVASVRTLGGDIERNVTGLGKIQEAAKGTVERVQEVGEKSLGEILGKLREVANDVFWYVVSRDKVNAVVGLIHMLGFSTAYGMSVWVTFISSYILGRCLPRQQFGIVQSRIYPVYFKAMAYCISAALLAHLAGQKKDSLTGMIGSQGLSLLSALLMDLANLFVFDPRATKTMYEKMKIEKEEGRGVEPPTRDGIIGPDGLPPQHGGATATATTAVVRPGRTYRDTLVDNEGPNAVRPVVAERQDVLALNAKLRRLNTYSSVLNGLTFIALTWYMAYLGRQLHATR
ncbi:uncharacterized protein LOC143581730 [Bidens hawaiensis]|uniref:uncharacterized protein LOC143581730 n=1 Tax=Bidens hawaiensis TaxID=980011 RepID=UPI00404B6867